MSEDKEIYKGQTRQTYVPERDKSGCYKKGVSGNPFGKNYITYDIRLLMREKSAEYKRKFFHWLDSDKEELLNLTGAPWKITTLDECIVSALRKAIDGDTKALDAILDRVMGKSVQSIDLTYEGGSLQHMINKLTQLNDNQLIEQAEIAQKTLKGTTIDV